MNIYYKKAINGTVLSLSSLFLLAGCNRADNNQTVGQKIDSTLATAENKADDFIAKASVETNEARANFSHTLDEIATTAAINAELMKDAQLSAVQINVDTKSHKVTLMGAAPDAASKERATLIAKNTDGVLAVDNQLTVVTR
jgi:hyperosmotically inducible protein